MGQRMKNFEAAGTLSPSLEQFLGHAYDVLLQHAKMALFATAEALLRSKLCSQLKGTAFQQGSDNKSNCNAASHLSSDLMHGRARHMGVATLQANAFLVGINMPLSEPCSGAMQLVMKHHIMAASSCRKHAMLSKGPKIEKIPHKKIAVHSRSPCRLKVWDVAETIWKHQLRVKTVCEARDIHMCWAPMRPSLLVRAAQQHLVIDLDGHEFRQRVLHNEVALGGCPQWALTAEVSLGVGLPCLLMHMLLVTTILLTSQL